MYQVGNLVKELSDKHGRERESLMPILQDIVQNTITLPMKLWLRLQRNSIFQQLKSTG